jgi:hypothetical protein
MPAPKLKFPAFAALGRQVVLLPDDAFFVRSVPLATGEGAAGVESQVELAMEAMAPFPVAQLYYGYWTKPGVDRALVFAAYRKRFTAEEVETWATADWVVPRFATLLGGKAPEPATAWVLAGSEGLTVVFFGDATGVPTAVRAEALAADAEPAARTAVRDGLLKSLGGTRTVIDVPEITIEPGAPGEGEFVARGATLVSELPLAQAEMLDVRDKAELTARRRARARDRWMWRGALLGVAVLALCALAEMALLGVSAWQSRRLAVIAQQTPIVTEITTAHALASRIEELTTKRLMPIEMIEIVSGLKPNSIQFTRTTTSGRYTLEVEAKTSNQAEIEQYKRALESAEATDTVQIETRGMQNNVTTFRMTVTFNPSVLAAGAQGASS